MAAWRGLVATLVGIVGLALASISHAQAPAAPILEAPTSLGLPEASQRVDGTNVVRVPFGVRRAQRRRPERPDHWATLVLPFQAGGGGTPPPPHAA